MIIVIIIILLLNAKVAFSGGKSRLKVYRLRKGAQIQVHLMFKVAFSCCSECVQRKTSNMHPILHHFNIICDKITELCLCKH